jgi:uncharacterized protein YmfQ (DUF2313 family)
MTCAVTPQDYANSLRQLLPPGPAWQYEDAEVLAGLLLALADSYNRLHNRTCDLLREIIPDSTSEMLTDWERVAGLPDDCANPTATFEERRAALVSKLQLVGGQSPEYYVTLAASLGFAIEVFQYQPFTVGGSAVGDALTNNDDGVAPYGWQYVWRVKAVTQRLFAFRAGLGRVGEPLRDWGNGQLECILNKWKPAHTVILFDYGELNYV